MLTQALSPVSFPVDEAQCILRISFSRPVRVYYVDTLDKVQTGHFVLTLLSYSFCRTNFTLLNNAALAVSFVEDVLG